jgi:hypothetical protein
MMSHEIFELRTLRMIFDICHSPRHPLKRRRRAKILKATSSSENIRKSNEIG